METGPEKSNLTEHGWTVRVRWTDDKEAKVYSGKHMFSVGKQASFTEEEARTTAVEYLLGALGGDLVSGFQRQAAKRGVVIDDEECIVTGRLGNPLVFQGVVGEVGRPGFDSIGVTLYVGADSDEATLMDVWRTTLATSPMVSTLERCVKLSLDIRLMG
jgi:hypothetical protein